MSVPFEGTTDSPRDSAGRYYPGLWDGAAFRAQRADAARNLKVALYDATGAALLTSANPGAVDLTDRAARLLGVADVSDRAARQLGAVSVSGTAAARLTRDTGRTPIALVGEVVGGVTAVSMVNLRQQVGGAASTTGTGYTVAAGRALRLTHLYLSFIHTATTILQVQVRLRAVFSGTVGTGSPDFLTMRMGTPSGAAPAAGQAAAPHLLALPDGLDLAAGAQVGLSHVGSAAAYSLDVTLMGFEYTP